MVVPVQPSRRAIAPNQVEERRVPVGVGGAQDQLDPPIDQGPGYVETALYWVKELIVSIYRRISAFFGRPLPTAVPAPEALAPAPEAAPMPAPAERAERPERQILDRLTNPLTDDEVLHYFEQYFKHVDREEVFFRIGAPVPLSYAQSMSKALFAERSIKINTGKQMVKKDVTLLFPYIKRKLQEEINRPL